MRDKITDLLTEVGEDYKKREIAIYKIHQGNDVHAFYRILPRQTKEVVHVQGYPGMSTKSEMRVFARLMNYDRMLEIRKAGGVSIGNEHDSVIRPFPNFREGVMIPYETQVLESMLGENVPKLSTSIIIPRFGPLELEGQQIVPADKRSLRDYLKTIDLRNAVGLRERSGEIMANVRKVMTPYVDGERGEPLRDYYVPAVRMIEDAFRRGDFQKSFPEALDFMIGSVEWE
ncbi:MAG: hypothetical protein Q8N63_03645 [Nanoarchaeota archaeon]|nr:hypothetical protein [Nanoarchaeota archaeon]